MNEGHFNDAALENPYGLPIHDFNNPVVDANVMLRRLWRLQEPMPLGRDLICMMEGVVKLWHTSRCKLNNSLVAMENSSVYMAPGKPYISPQAEYASWIAETCDRMQEERKPARQNIN